MVFLGKGVQKIYSKVAGEQPCRSVISIKLLCIFIEIALRHGFPPVNLLYIFRTSFLENTSPLADSTSFCTKLYIAIILSLPFSESLI